MPNHNYTPRLVDLASLVEQVHPSWSSFVREQSSLPYFNDLLSFVNNEYATCEVFPPRQQILRAMQLTPLDGLKVVIVGQDPYHGPGQAEGLSFSVPDGVKIPPSLRNIFKELNAHLGTGMPARGHLGAWARQGVLLLNTVLTVRAGQAGSHQHVGWEQFTNAIVSMISARRQSVVFILWGNHAKSMVPLIDPRFHEILTAAHPSPLSAHNGFWGCKHFSKTNEYLISCGLTPVDWQLPTDETLF